MAVARQPGNSRTAAPLNTKPALNLSMRFLADAPEGGGLQRDCGLRIADCGLAEGDARWSGGPENLLNAAWS